jgi:hypothetical protein
MPLSAQLGWNYDWTATRGMAIAAGSSSADPTWRANPATRRLEFAAFSVKSMRHDFQG